MTDDNKSSTLTNPLENTDYIKWKEERHKGSSMLNNIEEIKEESKKINKLCEDLKDSSFELNYNAKNKEYKYTILKIGNKNYTEFNNDINKIGSDDCRKNDTIKKFINYLNDVKEYIEEKYDGKNDFKLKLYIKGNKGSFDFICDCFYILCMKDKPEKTYLEKNILVNGVSEALFNLINDLE